MKTCIIEGCENKYYGRGLCSKHYQQNRIHGRIFTRTYLDKNNVKFVGDLAFIELYNKKQEVIAMTIIDRENWDKVANLKWHLMHTGYAATNKFKKYNRLHHFIFGIPPIGLETDHINRNRLDNRKANLRFCTRSQNRCNSKRANKSSKYSGVSKNGDNWKAQIKSLKHGLIHLGTFSSELKAAQAYNQAALQYHGEFARLNQL